MIVYERKLDVSRAGLSNRRQRSRTQSCTHTDTHTRARDHYILPVYTYMLDLSHVYIRVYVQFGTQLRDPRRRGNVW
jgi:hypothetical protein